MLFEKNYTMGFCFFIANLSGVLLGLIFLILSLKFTYKKDYKIKLIPVKFMFYFLVILEIIKIFYLISTREYFNIKNVPIIYCSSAMYLYFIISYTKKDSLINRMAYGSAIFPFLVMGILYLFIFPDIDRLTSLDGIIINTHSRVYHLLMLFLALYLIINKMYDFRFKDFIPASLFSSLYFQFCTILSLLIGGDISNFGPLSKELGFLYDKVGYASGNVLLAIAALIAGFIGYLVANLIIKLARIIKNKKEFKNSSR